MRCPNCQQTLQTVTYEGIEVGTCPGCAGEWLDSDELGKIVRRREQRFDAEAQRAIAESTTITGVPLEDVDRNLTCPKCNGQTDSVNYGGDSGIIIDRCAACGGMWLDKQELENIQMLVEGWQDNLPEDLKEYGPMLRKTADEVDQRDDVEISQLPRVRRWINPLINGILDLGGI